MKQLIALFSALVVSLAGAQTVQTTNNLITSGTTHTWSGVQTGAIPSNYMPGGPTPKYDPATNTFQFSYGQATVAQTIAINNALQGSGVQVNGYQYSYQLRNMNGDDRQGNVDTITINTALKSPGGVSLLSSTETYNTKFDWTTVSGTRTATTPYALAEVGTLNFSATSKDTGFWAGYFGPQVRNVDMRLNYTVDPCATNPAYSPSCAAYNTVNVSNNLVPNPTGYATGGSSIEQSYAINQALALSGANVMIHGFQWGYQANANGPYCAFWLVFCLDNRNPSVTTNVNITDSGGNSLYTITRNYQNSYNTTNYQYVFPSSKNLLTLGRFNFTATTNDQAYIGDIWSKALYTPDPCTINPLSSSSCPGYQQAYHDQQCSSSPLYAVDCPGYQAAYLTQQCTASPLYNQSCPGYEVAYKSQQCSLSPLYATDCPGYDTAYKSQQCSLNALYATDCPGYTQAYFNQQCSADPLYNSQCPGYSVAYKNQQCSLSPLYATDCPGYAQAYFNQQCSASPLYNSQCPGYGVAYHDQQCGINPLYASDCRGYQQAYHDQQCNANPLYASDCPGYAVAYKSQQCSLNSLYATDCPGYAVAFKAQQCSLNPLYATDCPGYAAAFKSQQCSISALYATDCPGYAQAYFSQQCSLNGLYDRACPNYSTAYAKTQLLTQPSPTAATQTSSVTTTDAAVTTATNALSTGISDSTVSKAVAATSNSNTTSQTSPTSVIGSNSVLAPTAAAQAATQSAITSVSITPPATQAQVQERQVDAKKTDTAVASVERKAGGNRAEVAKQVQNAAKEAAQKSQDATSMEAQVASQGVVVGLMGYVPGFSAYQNAIVPDVLANAVSRQYMKPNVDNRNVQRRLSGANEARWQEMVNDQYQIGK